MRVQLCVVREATLAVSAQERQWGKARTYTASRRKPRSAAIWLRKYGKGQLRWVESWS